MTFLAEVKLLMVWLVLAELTAVALFIVLLVRKPPEQDTYWQTARRYFGLANLICVAIPAVVFVARVGYEAYTYVAPVVLDYWWVSLVLLAVAALVGAAVWLARVERPTPMQSLDAAPVAAAPPPVPLWTAPVSEQWDGR